VLAQIRNIFLLAYSLAETRWPGTPSPVVRSPLIPTGSRVRVSYEAPDRFYCPFRTAQKQLINCHFYLAPDPLWAWVCSVLDPQDSINELLNCVWAWIYLLREKKNGGPVWTAALKRCRISLLVQSGFKSKSRGVFRLLPAWSVRAMVGEVGRYGGSRRPSCLMGGPGQFS